MQINQLVDLHHWHGKEEAAAAASSNHFSFKYAERRSIFSATYRSPKTSLLTGAKFYRQTRRKRKVLLDSWKRKQVNLERLSRQDVVIICLSDIHFIRIVYLDRKICLVGFLFRTAGCANGAWLNVFWQ